MFVWKKWIAHVVCFDKEFQDYLIQFLHPPGLRQAYWFPDDELEQCFKSHEQILGVLLNHDSLVDQEYAMFLAHSISKP